MILGQQHNMENWLHVNPSSGSGNGEVEISADLNNGAERTGTVEITGNNSNITRQVEVTQMRGMAGLTISVTFNSTSGAIELRKIKDNTLYTPDSLYTELTTLYGTIQDNTSAVAVTLYAPNNLKLEGITPMTETNRSIIPATIFYSHFTPSGGSVSNTINIIALKSEGAAGYSVIHINGTTLNNWTYNNLTPVTYVFAVTPRTNTVSLYKNGRRVLTASSEWDNFNKYISYSSSISGAIASLPVNIYLSYDDGSTTVDTHFTLFPLTAVIAKSATEIKLAFNHFEFPGYTNISFINAHQNIIEWEEGSNPSLVSCTAATIYSGT